MRWCWNWQTGTFEGRVAQAVEVQVLSSAQGTDSRKGVCCLNRGHFQFSRAKTSKLF